MILLVHNIIDAATDLYHYHAFAEADAPMMMLGMVLMLMLMRMVTQPVSVDEKVFHAVSKVLGSILRDVKDPPGLNIIMFRDWSSFRLPIVIYMTSYNEMTQ